MDVNRTIYENGGRVVTGSISIEWALLRSPLLRFLLTHWTETKVKPS